MSDQSPTLVLRLLPQGRFRLLWFNKPIDYVTEEEAIKLCNSSKGKIINMRMRIDECATPKDPEGLEELGVPFDEVLNFDPFHN